MTHIEITENSRPYEVGVHDGVESWTTCQHCGLLNIRIEFEEERDEDEDEDSRIGSAAEFCDTCIAIVGEDELDKLYAYEGVK